MEGIPYRDKPVVVRLPEEAFHATFHGRSLIPSQTLFPSLCYETPAWDVAPWVDSTAVACTWALEVVPVGMADCTDN